MCCFGYGRIKKTSQPASQHVLGLVRFPRVCPCRVSHLPRSGLSLSPLIIPIWNRPVLITLLSLLTSPFQPKFAKLLAAVYSPCRESIPWCGFKIPTSASPSWRHQNKLVMDQHGMVWLCGWHLPSRVWFGQKKKENHIQVLQNISFEELQLWINYLTIFKYALILPINFTIQKKSDLPFPLKLPFFLPNQEKLAPMSVILCQICISWRPLKVFVRSRN